MDTLTLFVICFVVVVVVISAAFSLYTIMFPVQTAADRLDRLTEAATSTIDIPVADLLGNRDPTPWEQIAARLGALATPGGDPNEPNPEVEKLRRMLKHAGYNNRRALDIFNGSRVAGAMLMPVVVSPLGFFLAISATAFAMVIAMAIGYYAPYVVLMNQAQGRQGELLRSFPDALDLLVSSVESGLGLDQAFRRVAQEMDHVAPALSREFVLVNSEVSAGIERAVALKHFEERTGLEEVKSLVNMLTQAERFGSSVADSLKIYSHVARERRMSRAEEAAGAVGSKLTIIMIVFFLPVLMMILMAPAGIRMMTENG